MISVDEAMARVLAVAQPLGTETLSLTQARNRVLATEVHAQHPLPLFTQSAVDGYALRHIDLVDLPQRFALGLPIAARAQAEHPVLAPGQAMRILTGGLLPLGADTVVRQELTEKVPRGDTVQILRRVACGTDIRRVGEEMAQGALVAAAGKRLTPGLVGALALAGVQQLSVFKLPRIVVLVSGDEVVSGAHDGPLQLGQVPDANGPLLQAFLSDWGMAPLRVEAVADTAAAVRAALTRAFADADLVLTTGGVSVGDHDYIPAMAEALGSDRVLWKVAQKPGMPLYVARHRQTLLFGLPGNPASVLVNLLVYVRAALDAMQGVDPANRWYASRLNETASRDAVKTLWLRGQQQILADGSASIRLLQGQASHMIGNLVDANVLLRVEPEGEANTTVVFTPIC